MPPIQLTESVPQVVDLTQAQAAALIQLGRRLASDKARPGSDEVADPDRTVIRVTPHSAGQWQIRVNDAVGAFATGGQEFLVAPKIPDAHLLWLLGHSDALPRIDPHAVQLEAGESLIDLVSRWFVRSTEELLRHDLSRDYHETAEVLSLVRGRIRPLATVQALHRGRVEIHCEFDEFDADNPLNRILLAAATAISANPILGLDIRQAARRLTLRLDGISPLQASDLHAQVDRRTHHYRDAIAFGKAILHGTGRTLAGGANAAWTFLIRTPDLVELGVRNILTKGLSDLCEVTNRQLPLNVPGHSLNPDLVFGDGIATGDVKYRLTDRQWASSHRDQAVTFATGYRCAHALVISFAPGGMALPMLEIGEVQLSHVAWDCAASKDPAAAGDEVIASVRAWCANAISASHGA